MADGERRWALTRGTLTGLAVALGPIMILVAVALYAPDSSLLELAGFPPWLAAALACAVAVALGGLAMRRSSRAGSALVALAVLGFIALSVPALSEHPALALAILLPAVAAILRFFGPFKPIDGPPTIAASDPYGQKGAAISSSGMALLAWLLVAVFCAANGRSASLLALLSSLLALAFGARWILGEKRLAWRWRIAAAAIAIVSMALAFFARTRPSLSLTCLAAIPASVLIFARAVSKSDSVARAKSVDLWHTIVEHPARLFAATFLALIAAGSFFLALPVCASRGEALEFVDAAFTAVSATCVTGLSVVDTATAFSATGQAAILVLIQLGGLGVMTFYAAGLVLLGRRLALKQEAAMADMLGREDRRELGRALAQVLVTTFAFELLGALALAGLFRLDGAPFGTAMWRGAFTAVSAFCNAGFALSTDNLVSFNREPLVLHIVASLIVAGGLGPMVIASLPSLVRRNRAPLQAKIALSMTAILLISGATLFCALEWRGALAGLPVADRLHNAIFQSVTARTAGFNSVDLTAIGPATVTAMVVLMFIGGSPGSTAGGIKTTTAALLVAAVRAALRGRPEVSLFGRHVPHFAVYKAAAIASLYAGAAIAGVLVLEVTQKMDPQTAVFEVVSALGTVGLTIGGTAQLDGVGEIAIMVCMFLGRVGPLTMFMILAGRREETRVRLPEEDVSLG